MAESALAGIRVLDLTQVMAGPFCTMVLADLGADVIKVEVPGTGDQTRRSWGRPGPGGDSAGFYALNRNKRSVELDLRSGDGLDAFLRLVDTADVVIESFRPGVAERLGIGYPALSARKPELVYASISGFGQSGPYSQRPGYDLIAQAMAGAISVTGEPDGSPVKCGLPIGDLGAGLLCGIGILSAYLHRVRTGEGQHVETSLYEAVLAMSVWESAEYWRTGNVPQRLGSAHRMSAPYQVLRTRDGYLAIGANNQRLWEKLCDAIGRPDLAEDPRFGTNADRMDNRPALSAELESIFRDRGTDDWVELLLGAGVPAGPVLDYGQILGGDPHALARGMIQQTDHPVAGTVNVLGPPLKLSRTPASIRRPPPLLGEHNAELAEIQNITADGAAGSGGRADD